MVVSYTDNNQGHNPNLTFGGVYQEIGTGACTNALSGGSNPQTWCVSEKINNITAGAILDNNAQMVITVGLPTSATPNTEFSINFQPSVGAVLPIQKTIPGGLTAVQPLY
jgi:flagellin FlaB